MDEPDALTSSDIEAGGVASTVLSLVGVSKQYGGTWVVTGVHLNLSAGEIHAVCGENGAGKSTLVNIIGGVVPPEEGSIVLDGEPVRFHGPSHARELGISVIHQHPVLFPDLSIAENMFLAHKHERALSLMRHKRASREARETLRMLGIDLDPGRTASSLTIADQQMVEIAKALMQRPRVLILDEPTASLTPHEVTRLFTILKDLKSQGTALLIVNHRMAEVFEISDRITVLRNGSLVSTSYTREVSASDIVRRMVGRDVQPRRKGNTSRGAVMLETAGLGRRGVFGGISLQVHAGEIVGLAGLIGAGRTDIARAIFGLDHLDSGEIRIGGQRIDVKNARAAMAAGVAFVPEDRHLQALAMDGSITENIVIASLPEVSSHLRAIPGRERTFTQKLIDTLRVACRGPGQSVATLSGGNQQKVVLARWLATHPTVLLLDEPTFGVDVGAQQEIHELIRALAREGVAVLLISSDLIELRALSDRIVVIRDGRIAAEFAGAEADEVSIMSAAVGGVTG